MAEKVTTEEKEQASKSNKITEWINNHPKAVFWIRFALWSLCACVIPFLFIVYRFQLFQTISKIQIGGWGMIAIIIVAVFAFSIIRYVKMALSAKYSLAVQILNGICKIIIPLVVVMVIIYNIKSNIDLFIQVLGVVIISEMVAIPLNPLPKWAYEQQKNVREEERKETVDYLLDSFFKKKKEQEK